MGFRINGHRAYHTPTGFAQFLHPVPVKCTKIGYRTLTYSTHQPAHHPQNENTPTPIRLHHPIKRIPKSPKKPTISVIYYPQQNVHPSQNHPAPPQQTNAHPPPNPTTQTQKKRKPHDLDRPRSTWIDLTRHSALQPPGDRRESGVCVSRSELARTGNRLQKRKN